MVGAAPSVGDSWLTHVMAYNRADHSLYSEFDLTFGAIEVVSLTVPAGTYPCLGVGPRAAPAPIPNVTGSGLALDGSRVTASLRLTEDTPTDWYSPGVGVAQYDVGGLWRLVGFGQVTPALASSWGAVKTRYR